jgi:polyisoprenyl-phosphate glycosyltransferase
MYSLIIPVYKNQGTIEPLAAVLEQLNTQLGGRLEVVFVVDGSPDRSRELLEEQLSEATFAAELIELSRNFGSFAAIRMGLSAAQGPYFAVMAADLQEPPELIFEFFQTLEREPVDVVVGSRSERNDPPMSRWLAQTYWSFYKRWIQSEMPSGGVDVFACNEAVKTALLSCNESNTSLVGLLVWLGFRKKAVPYVRQARLNGKSAWTLRKKLRYMFNSLFSFSDLPIWLLTLIGCLGTAVSVVASIVVLVSWAIGNINVPGYVPIVLMLSFSMFLQLLSVGLIGGYVWQAYENTKRRPLFVPMSRQSFRDLRGSEPQGTGSADQGETGRQARGQDAA